MKILIKTLVAVCLNTMMYLPICTHAEGTAIELKENQFVTLVFPLIQLVGIANTAGTLNCFNNGNTRL